MRKFYFGKWSNGDRQMGDWYLLDCKINYAIGILIWPVVNLFYCQQPDGEGHSLRWGKARGLSICAIAMHLDSIPCSINSTCGPHNRRISIKLFALILSGVVFCLLFCIPYCCSATKHQIPNKMTEMLYI